MDMAEQFSSVLLLQLYATFLQYCVSSPLDVWTLHSEMQQRARLKSVDRFRANEHSILVATDAAARGLDIPGVRTVVHYQLPLSAEVYVHRCGRTARALTDGCSIALISPNDASKFASLCRSFSKETFQRFPIELSYMSDYEAIISCTSNRQNYAEGITGKG